MRVLVLTMDFPPDMGGSATRAYNAAKGLLLNGCEVTVVTSFPYYPDGDIPKEYKWKPFKVTTFDGIEVIRTFMLPLASKGLVNRMVLFLCFILSSLFAIQSVGRVDVVWAAHPNIISLLPSVVYGLLKKCPVSLNVDDLWPEDLYSLGMLREHSLGSRVAEFLARFAYSKADLVTPASPGYAGVIVRKYGVDPEKIEVVSVGVDLEKFRMANHDGDSGLFKVFYSGSFSTAYDFDQVLMAAELLEDREDIEFILQGGGELIPHVKSKAWELKLKNLKIIEKIFSREELANLLSEADALILPLRDFGRPYLGISSKLYEYQAVGKPIICCAEGQPAKYLKETNSGIVVKPGDYESLARAVVYLRENPKAAGKMGALGRKYVAENVAIESIGSKFKRTLETCCMQSKQTIN